MFKLPYTAIGIVTLVLLLLLVLIFVPLAFIWSVNTLFGLTIPYTFETWVAVVMLQLFFKSDIINYKTKG